MTPSLKRQSGSLVLVQRQSVATDSEGLQSPRPDSFLADSAQGDFFGGVIFAVRII